MVCSLELKLAREFEIRVDACVLPVAVAQPEDESDRCFESCCCRYVHSLLRSKAQGAGAYACQVEPSLASPKWPHNKQQQHAARVCIE